MKIEDKADPRTSSKRWSFVNRSYNFDSAAGLVYEVDVTKPFGQRVKVISLADGSAFSEEDSFKVAMTSYRASGGGSLLHLGAGIDTDNIDERVVERYPEIRELLYAFLQKYGTISEELISNPSIIGHWSFVPESLAKEQLDSDMALVF